MLYSIRQTVEQRPELVHVTLSSLAAAGWTEKNLEDMFAMHIEDIMRSDKLLVVTQERLGQEAADILALDAVGNLYIFELKRWRSGQENLLQVLRYGQIFGQFGYDELEGLFRRYKGKSSGGLQQSHKEYFELDALLDKNAFNQKQEFIVVTAGTDLATLDAIRYWKELGLKITPLTFHVYKHKDEYFLEIQAFSPDSEDYATLLSGAYVVNTPVQWKAETYQHMFDNDRVSAFWDRKSRIDHIQKGDQVVLYFPGVGVIACGVAQSRVRVGDYDAPGEEHYIPVKWDVKFSPYEERHKCVSAYEINSRFGTSQRFRLTCQSIPKEIASYIEKRMKENEKRGL